MLLSSFLSPICLRSTVVFDEWVAFNSLYGWPADPLFTESNWDIDSPYIRIFMREATSTQVGG